MISKNEKTKDKEMKDVVCAIVFMIATVVGLLSFVYAESVMHEILAMQSFTIAIIAFVGSGLKVSK